MTMNWTNSDKFDAPVRFLFMDPSAERVSFTSDKNRPPKTLQMVADR